MRPVCDSELQGRAVSIASACIPRSQDPARLARPAVPQCRRCRPAVATGPSSSLITQYHAWKMGGRGEGRCGEGHVETGVTRGAGTLVRNTAFPGCVRPQMSLCVRAQHVLASFTPDQDRKCARIRLSPDTPAPASPPHSSDVARAVSSLRRARAPSALGHDRGRCRGEEAI
jgi:hypothetical protein